MAFEMKPSYEMNEDGEPACSYIGERKAWTAREHLAAQFTAASISSNVEPQWTPRDHAVYGFMCADAMLAEGEEDDAAS